MLVCMSGWAQIRTMSVLGDSYSTFEGFITPRTNLSWYSAKPDSTMTDVTDARQTWWYNLAIAMGWKIDTNNSYSGSTICNTGYRREDYSDRSFITRMDNLGSPDIIFIFGGTNDSWAHSPIGEYKYADFTAADLYNFRPAMAHMLDYMTARYPFVEKIFLLNDGLSADITTSIKTICKHYGVPCLPLKDIDKRAGHPTVEGHSQIAEQVSDILKPLLSEQ